MRGTKIYKSGSEKIESVLINNGLEEKSMRDSTVPTINGIQEQLPVLESGSGEK